MARATFKLFRGRNPKQVGAASFFGKSFKAAQRMGRSVLRGLGGRERNVAEGAFYGGVFHPYRRSPDYDPERTGEEYQYAGGDRPRRKRKKKRRRR